jgi:TATA-box binding protein (TBP) (component of TFIID and TFIIIB)
MRVVVSIFNAVECFQMTQELSLEALHMEQDLINFDLDSYRDLVRKETMYGRMFMGFIAGIVLFIGSAGAMSIKNP